MKKRNMYLRASHLAKLILKVSPTDVFRIPFFLNISVTVGLLSGSTDRQRLSKERRESETQGGRELISSWTGAEPL